MYLFLAYDNTCFKHIHSKISQFNTHAPHDNTCFKHIHSKISQFNTHAPHALAHTHTHTYTHTHTHIHTHTHTHTYILVKHCRYCTFLKTANLPERELENFKVH